MMGIGWGISTCSCISILTMNFCLPATMRAIRPRYWSDSGLGCRGWAGLAGNCAKPRTSCNNFSMFIRPAISESAASHMPQLVCKK